MTPLRIIQQATSNGAKVLGKENEIGRVRQGDAVLKVRSQDGEARHRLRLALLGQGRERCRRSLPSHGRLLKPAIPAVRKGIGQRTVHTVPAVLFRSWIHLSH